MRIYQTIVTLTDGRVIRGFVSALSARDARDQVYAAAGFVAVHSIDVERV